MFILANLNLGQKWFLPIWFWPEFVLADSILARIDFCQFDFGQFDFGQNWVLLIWLWPGLFLLSLFWPVLFWQEWISANFILARFDFCQFSLSYLRYSSSATLSPACSLFWFSKLVVHSEASRLQDRSSKMELVHRRHLCHMTARILFRVRLQSTSGFRKWCFRRNPFRPRRKCIWPTDLVPDFR